MVGKVFTNILSLTFHYPWTKSLGQSSVNLLTQAKGDLQSTATGTADTSLKYLPSEVVSYSPTIRWNSQTGQMTIFGTQKSVLQNNMLHLALLSPTHLYIAIFMQQVDAQMPWPRS